VPSDNLKDSEPWSHDDHESSSSSADEICGMETQIIANNAINKMNDFFNIVFLQKLD
jgi:hypothetical protein